MTKTKSNNDTIITIYKDEVVSLRRASENLEYAKKQDHTAEERLAIFEEGKMDADIYYTGYKRPGTIVLVTSLVSPIVALLLAVISSAIPVKDQNRGYPPTKEPRIDAYYSGYVIRSQQKKVKVVWRNWGIGLAVNFVLVLWLINN